MKFADGIPFVFSRQTHLVSVSLPEDASALDSEFSQIAISVVNCGDHSFVIDARNVHISSDNPKLRVVPETEIEDRINSRAGWARIANAFASAASVAAASMPTTTTYTGAAYGGGSYVGYSGVVSSYDPARAAVATNAISQQQARTDREIEEARRAQVDAFASGFKRHTLGPTEVYLGGIYVENKQLRRSTLLRILVGIGGEAHAFEVILDAAGSSAERTDYASALPQPDSQIAVAASPTSSGELPTELPAMNATNHEATEAPAAETNIAVTGLFRNQRLTFETKDGRKFVNARVTEFNADFMIVITAVPQDFAGLS